ncbi:MAG: DUF1848 domain-containing protein [PVC group bacterium]
MIISASRRTDIPAFYSRWFINRVREGWCEVPHPFNREQVSRISLLPQGLDCIVFWTRNPRPLFPYLRELNERGFHYYFQYTVLNNPRELDSGTPSLPVSIKTFRELAGRIGAERVIWRYDPIVFSSITTAAFHRDTYERIARALRGCTRRSVVSIVDFYPRIGGRLNELEREGITFIRGEELRGSWFDDCMASLARSAQKNGMEIVSCSEGIDLTPYGITPGKCIDDQLIRRVFGIEVKGRKDPGQRRLCHCVLSRDIGVYDTCTFGCRYCYATASFQRAAENYRRHNPAAASLIPPGKI